MSMVKYFDIDNDGKETYMQCQDCLGVLFKKTEDFKLDSEPSLILGTEFECIQCGKRQCLLSRNPQIPPPPSLFP